MGSFQGVDERYVWRRFNSWLVANNDLLAIVANLEFKTDMGIVRGTFIIDK